MIDSHTLMELMSFQNVVGHLERERRSERLAHQVTEAVADWRQQIRLWYAVQRRYRRALTDKDWLTARNLAEVLMEIYIPLEPKRN